MSNIEVAGLHYYPIKSCGAISPQEVTFTEYGIQHDREWMLIGSRGQFLSQRVLPQLALVEQRIEQDALIVQAPGMSELAIPLQKDPDAEVIAVDLWKKPGTGVLQSKDTRAYFTEYLGKDARLIRVAQPRLIKPEARIAGATEHTAFADGFPLLLASVDSMTALNSQLAKPVTIDRFRANIVTRGSKAYDEDYWRELQIGDLHGFVARACARCPMPNIDQQEGVLPRERPITEALRATRQGTDLLDNSTGEFFGQNVVHEFAPGTVVRIGDAVTVNARSTERNIQLAA